MWSPATELVLQIAPRVSDDARARLAGQLAALEDDAGRGADYAAVIQALMLAHHKYASDSLLIHHRLQQARSLQHRDAVEVGPRGQRRARRLRRTDRRLVRLIRATLDAIERRLDRRPERVDTALVGVLDAAVFLHAAAGNEALHAQRDRPTRRTPAGTVAEDAGLA